MILRLVGEAWALAAGLQFVLWLVQQRTKNAGIVDVGWALSFSLVVAWFAGQSAINIGMVLGLLPTIGVPLPVLSYGGTALIAVMSGIGLIANVRGRRFVN